MKSIIYTKSDIINLIKLNVAAFSDTELQDLYVKIGDVSAEVIRKDKREINIEITKPTMV